MWGWSLALRWNILASCHLQECVMLPAKHNTNNGRYKMRGWPSVRATRLSVALTKEFLTVETLQY